MAQFGERAPFGLLQFGANQTDAERYYQTWVEQLKSVVDIQNDLHAHASFSARAIALGAFRTTLQNAKNQRHPLLATEFLSSLEQDWGTPPLPTDSDDTRRHRVAAKMVQQRGSRPEALFAALQNLLGSNFVGVRHIKPEEFYQWPPDPSLVATFPEPRFPAPIFKFVTPVWKLGVPCTFSYVKFTEDDGARLQIGQTVCAEPENSGLAEPFTVLSTGEDWAGRPTATAVFQHGHNVGGTIQSYAPVVTSRAGHVIIYVAPGTARDNVTYQTITDLLREILKSTSTFAIYETNGLVSYDGFLIGVSFIGDLIGPSSNSVAPAQFVGDFTVGIDPIGVADFPLT